MAKDSKDARDAKDAEDVAATIREEEEIKMKNEKREVTAGR